MDKQTIIIIAIAILLIWLWCKHRSSYIEGVGFPMGAYPYDWHHGYQFQSPFFGFNSNDPAYYQRQYIWY